MTRDVDDHFAVFVDRESIELLRVGWYLTANPDDARDLVQEALTRVSLRWGTLRRGEELGYVCRTMVNIQTDAARRRGRAASLPFHGIELPGQEARECRPG